MSRLLGIVLVLLTFLVPVEASRISRRALDAFAEVSAIQAFLPHPSQASNSDAVVAQDTSERSATKARVRQMAEDAGSFVLGMINWEGEAASLASSAVPKV